MSGYKGRTGVYELMVADDEIRGLIHEQAAESKLFEVAQLSGMKTMREDGDRLVAEGVTSLEEVLRVTRE
jgi:general secretion pathway protein E